MKKSLTFFFALVAFSLMAQADLQLQQIDDQISMLVPSSLKRVAPTMQRTTSPSLATFISNDGKVDLGVNYAQLRWAQGDAKLLSQFYKANILNLYDQVNMLDERIVQINGREYILFEFAGQIIDEPNAFSAAKKQSDYTYIMYTIENDGVLIFRFTSPAIQMNKWREPVAEVMQSVSFSSGKRKK